MKHISLLLAYKQLRNMHMKINTDYLKSHYLSAMLMMCIILISCKGEKANTQHTKSQSTEASIASIDKSSRDTSIIDRIPLPPGYTRTDFSKQSFQQYLRALKLKQKGDPVRYYNGSVKTNNDVYHSVVDLKIGTKDLHQCADAVMRLKAEHLWQQGKYNEIHFNFTNGFRVDYTEWMKGRRMIVEGNKTYWNNRNQPSNSYEDFWNYMELIFMYAGTASLEKELKHIDIDQATSGDVLIQGGHPGHAVIIIDEAIDKDGKKIYLLAQSYMPAQDLQILLNPNNKTISPWYDLDADKIVTHEWVFEAKDLKRF